MTDQTTDFDQAIADLKAAVGELNDPNAVAVINGAIATIEEWHASAQNVVPNPDVPDETEEPAPGEPLAEEPDKADKTNAEDATAAPNPDAGLSTSSSDVNPAV